MPWATDGVVVAGGVGFLDVDDTGCKIGDHAGS